MTVRMNSLYSDHHRNMKIYDVYRPLSSKPLRLMIIFLKNIKDFVTFSFTHFGSWNRDLGLAMLLSKKWEIRKDLTDVHFKTASNHDPPFVSLELAESSQGLPYKYQLTSDGSGTPVFLGPSLYGDIWEALQRITNFSYSMVQSVDGSWGSQNEDGTWNGVVMD